MPSAVGPAPARGVCADLDRVPFFLATRLFPFVWICGVWEAGMNFAPEPGVCRLLMGGQRSRARVPLPGAALGQLPRSIQMVTTTFQPCPDKRMGDGPAIGRDVQKLPPTPFCGMVPLIYERSVNHIFSKLEEQSFVSQNISIYLLTFARPAVTLDSFKRRCLMRSIFTTLGG